MRTFVAYPPMEQVTGGMRVLVRVAEHLRRGGHDVALVVRDSGRDAAALAGVMAPDVRAGLPVLDWESAHPAPGDVWLCPEGWPALLLPGLRHQARTVLYVQNWAYLHSSLPEGLALGALPVHVVAVSQPVAWYVSMATGKSCTVLRPGIDATLFYSVAQGGAASRPVPAADAVRIAWMPRKNKALAGQIQALFAARTAAGAIAGTGNVEWVPIHRRTPDEVGELLRSCHLFLATGFPEGCPLPPLEAMACACPVVGFGGFGGWDYMRQAGSAAPVDGAGGASFQISSTLLSVPFQPWWPLRQGEDAPWGGNGWYVADADTIAAALVLEQAVELLRTGGHRLAAVREAAVQTGRAYGLAAQRAAVLELWQAAASGNLWCA